MSIFKRKRKIRIRVIEEDHTVPSDTYHVRSRSFYPGSKADYDTICEMMAKMGFRPSKKG